MVLSKDPLRVKSEKYDYLENYHVITKHDNPGVIMMYFDMAREEAGVVLRCEDLPEEPTGLHKTSRKRKQVASDAREIVQRPHKKKVVQ